MTSALSSKMEPAAWSGNGVLKPETKTSSPARPAPPRQQGVSDDFMPPQHYFATWYIVNLGALMIVGSLASESSTLDEAGKGVLAIIAVGVFFLSGIGVIITVYDVWPRSGHERILGGALGFGVALAYAIANPGWKGGSEGFLGRIAWAMAGSHLGFILEAVTGCIGCVLNVVGESREEPEPPKYRSSRDQTTVSQPSHTAPSP